MGFFEKLLRGMAGHHGSRRGDYGGGHRARHGDCRDGVRPVPPRGGAGQEADKSACPKCRTVPEEGARFCPVCGTSLAPRMCSACKGVVASWARFCPNCGKSQ